MNESFIHENKYQNNSKKQVEELEKEIAEIEAQNQPKPEEPEEKLSPEEANYKKRYSDLRSHAQKRENELRLELEKKNTQLEAATKKEMKFPKTEAEVTAWAEKYPDVYNMVVTIAKQNALEENKGLEERLNSISERELNFARQKAYAELLDNHPDFDEIKDSDEFKEWVEKQPLWIYNSLYENETDALAASRSIDLFKVDREKKKPKKNDDTRDAARNIRPKASPSPDPQNELRFTESSIQKMSSKDFEKHMEEIEEAMKNPAFYDISGAAR